MAHDAYTAPVGKIERNIEKNPQADGLKNALENVLSKTPKGGNEGPGNSDHASGRGNSDHAPGQGNSDHAKSAPEISPAPALQTVPAAAQDQAHPASGAHGAATVAAAGQDHALHTSGVLSDGSSTVSGGTGSGVQSFGAKKAEFVASVGADHVTVYSAQADTSTSVSHLEQVTVGGHAVLIDASNADHAVIARMYDAVMQSDASVSGLEHWSAAHDQGTSLQEIAHAFLSSPEFQASAGKLTDGAFVDQIYHSLFGQEASHSEYAQLTNQLAKGLSREDLVVSLAKSLEAPAQAEQGITIVDHTHGH
ncbi:DUF4214 domain-containing protein [Methylobacterium nigriterrae]|uniref:DUF4214 domain-containing protein n=1 Tax=Methylobacterium nigriterrae TaxID=3127512 RepID=UPI003013FE4D